MRNMILLSNLSFFFAKRGKIVLHSLITTRLRDYFNRLENRIRFYSVRDPNCWNSLPKRTAVAETVEAFKRCLKIDLVDFLYSYVD